MAGPIEDAPRPVEESLWKGAATFAPAIGALAIVGAAIGYYSGYLYVRAYAEEWGISFDALHYSAYDLITASQSTILSAILLPLVGLLLFVALRESSLPVILQTRVIHITLVGLFVLVLALVLLALRQTEWALFATLAGLSLAIIGTFVDRVRRQTAATAGLLFSLIVIIFVAAPHVVGQVNARRDRDESDRLPRVEVFSNGPLGLEGERRIGELFVSGPWRVIFVNNGFLWVTTTRGGKDSPVYQLAQRDIASLRYRNDSPPHETPTETQTPSAME